MSDSDKEYLMKMRKAYNILMSCTEKIALRLISLMDPDKEMGVIEVAELVRATKELFGQLDVRDTVFDRMVMRHRLNEIAGHARAAGDIKEERLALRQLINLDSLELKEAQERGPVIPELPPVNIIGDDEEGETEDTDAAIIESHPEDTDDNE